MPILPPVKDHNIQFGALAIQLGFATKEQVQECIRLQNRMKELGVAPSKLGDVLVAKGYLTEEKIKKIFEYQGTMGGHTHIAGYKIITKIGQGAMGSVYKALQISMDRIVAIKTLAPKFASDERFRERFLQEARSVARLNHPNIIQGIDVGVSNGIYYFAMEFVNGPTVGDLVKRGGSINEKKAINIIMQVAKALSHASQNSIIHRDIKPDNIMLTTDGIAKLCDLGLAKKVDNIDAQITNVKTAMGTPYYISPEQAKGEHDLDIRTDIYSLGCTFYYMVTGEQPFKGENGMVVISKHLSEQPLPPRKKVPLLSSDAERIILKMMAKNKTERYQTPDELLKDLETALTVKPAPLIKPSPVAKPQTATPAATHKPAFKRRGLSRMGRFRRRF